ncbi:MAG TPA: LysE family transporter [Flavobacterium sp.]|jgi:threonine/homoserine/homoserine lactone efflux protein
MGYTLPLFLGFLTASAGITPPGLINMTAAKVSVDEGQTRALVFALGATAVILIQTFIAVIFAQFIDQHPNVLVILREAGLAIFIALTIYFFWRGKNEASPEQKELKLHSKKSRFFLGMLLSALNFFPIPFYVFVSITLASYKYFFFNDGFIYTFVTGAGIGAFFAFYCYITFFKKLESRTAFLLKNMNYIIGSITGVISVATLVNIIQYYWQRG